MSTKQLVEKINALPPEILKQVEEFIEFLTLNKNKDVQKPSLKFGALKGKIWMSEDFDEPLEDFKDYM